MSDGGGIYFIYGSTSATVPVFRNLIASSSDARRLAYPGRMKLQISCRNPIDGIWKANITALLTLFSPNLATFSSPASFNK